MTIDISLVQSSFTSAAFSVSIPDNVTTAQTFTKYDIRVVPLEFTPIGSDALATTVNMQGLKVSPSGPSVLSIPINADSVKMPPKQLYKATIRLYSGTHVAHTKVGVFYYDTRTFTVDPISVSNNPNPNYPSDSDPRVPNFSHPTPVIKATDYETDPENADTVTLDPSGNGNGNDDIFKYVKFDKVCMSCTDITDISFNTDKFKTNKQYYLGEEPYEVEHTYNWELKDAGNHNAPLPTDSAFELWGNIQLAISDSFASLVPLVLGSFITPTFSFGFDIVASDETVGYNFVDPDVTLTMGDVVGVISAHPIKITLNNFNDYTAYKFTSITLKIRESDDLSSTPLFEIDKNGPGAATSHFGVGGLDVSANQVVVISTDLNGYVDGANPNVNLVNGQQYYFEIILNFNNVFQDNNNDLYLPSQKRSVVIIDQFDDSLNAITTAHVVNSWELDADHGDGLVVSFKKTDQFLGISSDVPYNLDMYGATTVTAEYSIAVDSSGNWTNWQPLTGGFIAQGDVVYNDVDASNNTTGIYDVPQSSGSALGPDQPDVNIYAEILNQANYNLVKIRLTLKTDNPSYDPSGNKTSSIFYVEQQTGYEYNLNNPSLEKLKDKIAITSDSDKALALPSFRYFPEAPVHNFTSDVPFITAINGNANAGYVADFSVPVSIPPYFQAVVTTDPSGNDFGNAAPYNYNAADVTDPYVDVNDHNVTGLSYPISFVGDDFVLSVKYVYLENTSIKTDVTDMTIQQQGLLPITDARVVNSWELDADHGAGLVVSFKKTAQFMGNSTVSYNLDAAGNQATVRAEYSITRNGNDWTHWLPLAGGSIAQGVVDYTVYGSNANGIYDVPPNSGSDLGPVQPYVNIYAVIPEQQANYKLVKVRLTLSTASSEYTPLIDIDMITNDNTDGTVANPSVPIGTSETYHVAPVSTATYPITDASVRYFPKADVHSFADTYEPKIGSVDASGNVHFIVPVNVPPYFSSSVTTIGSGIVSGTASVVSNSDGNSNQYLNGNVTGLSYAPTTNGSFTINVAYTSNENTAIGTIGVVSQEVKMQGLPSNSFTVPASSWDGANQQIDYTLSITATENTSHRMDGWNVYTKLSSESSWTSHGSLLRSDGVTNCVDLSESSYPAYATIDVKFVATRSIYLFSSNTTDQRETVQPNSTTDEEIVRIITLPNTLPAPTATDITLANLVYNTLVTTSQSGTLTVSKITSSNSANIARITITGPNDSTDTVHTSNNTLPLSFGLTSTSTALSYSVTYDYNQYVNNVLAPSVSSSGTVVTFTTSTSTRNAPEIDSKSYSESNEEFTLRYTSVNSGTLSDSAERTSIAYVKPYDAVNNNAAVELSDANGNNDADGEGNVDASGNAGMKLVLYVVDSFVTSYSVTVDSNSSTSHDTDAQIIQSPNSADFILAANPKIDEDSIVVNSNNTVKFSVNNNGAPVLHQVVLVVAQDSSDSENDSGFYALCIFTANDGFVAGTVVSDTLNLGGNNTTFTLTAISIDGAGMDMVTNFEFASSSSFATTNANIVLYVKNNTEGADSCAVVKGITITIPPLFKAGTVGSGTLTRTQFIIGGLDENRNKLAFDIDDNLWVGNWQTIKQFNSAGTFMNEHYAGSDIVIGLAFDSDGSMWISSPIRIRKFARNFPYIWTALDGDTTPLVQVNLPDIEDMLIDMEGNLLILTATNVVKYSKNGLPLTLSDPIIVSNLWRHTLKKIAVNKEGDIFTYFGHNGSHGPLLIKYNSSGTPSWYAGGVVSGGSSIAIDGIGDIIITTNTAITKYSPVNGTLIETFPAQCAPRGGIAIDPTGTIYVNSTGGVDTHS